MINIELIKFVLIIVIGVYILLNFNKIKERFGRFSRKSIITSFFICILFLVISILVLKLDSLLALIISLFVFITLSILLENLFQEKNTNKTTINNTEINHNYHTKIDTIDISKTFHSSQTNNHFEETNNVTNIDTIDNSKTFHSSQTNNHLEQINNVTNIESKQSIHKKQKGDNAKSSKKTINNLSEEQLRKIYNFFIDHNLLVDYNLEFENFKDIFLKEPIILKADVPTLREFYNNLKVQKNVTFNNITNDFLIYFINSNDNNIYDYKQFGNHKKTISKFSDDIIELFKKF